jgi:hypothetical protein
MSSSTSTPRLRKCRFSRYTRSRSRTPKMSRSQRRSRSTRRHFSPKRTYPWSSRRENSYSLNKLLGIKMNLRKN